MLGRRTVLIVSTVPLLTGLIVLGLSTSLTSILLSRAIQGLGDGMMFPNLMVYIAEISSAELRGSLCNTVNICQCLGLCLTFSVSLVVTWRTLTFLLLIPVLLCLVGLAMVPETPHWLAGRGRIEEAVNVLTGLRSNCQTQVG